VLPSRVIACVTADALICSAVVPVSTPDASLASIVRLPAVIWLLKVSESDPVVLVNRIVSA